MNQGRFGCFHGAVNIRGTGSLDSSNRLVGAGELISKGLSLMHGIDVRGIKRGDGLSSRCRYNFVVNEESSGLLVAAPIGSDNIDKEIHLY